MITCPQIVRAARDRAERESTAPSGITLTPLICKSMTRADGDLAQSPREAGFANQSRFEVTSVRDQQGALGDFIFAQRVAQDVCGREGLSGDMVRGAASL